MGKAWDTYARDVFVVEMREIFEECLRVMRPGAHGLVWALPRTSHWTATALEDAGFEIRDVVLHLFGTGFPKSLDVSKAIDKAAGAEREVIGPNPHVSKRTRVDHATQGKNFADDAYVRPLPPDVTAPATDAARQWSGWGTALKPAAEHWILARKPLVGTVAANVLAHGTGALNIDACRIGTTVETWPASRSYQRSEPGGRDEKEYQATKPAPPGRWPAHVTLDEDAAAVLDAQSLASGMHAAGAPRKGSDRDGAGAANAFKANAYHLPNAAANMYRFGDTGGASRFFYTAKPSKREKGEGNTHPTVKPIALMRWLARLITPPGGLVLDPFAGSGTTALACREEGFRFIGFEKDPQSFAIAERRIGK